MLGLEQGRFGHPLIIGRQLPDNVPILAGHHNLANSPTGCARVFDHPCQCAGAEIHVTSDLAGRQHLHGRRIPRADNDQPPARRSASKKPGQHHPNQSRSHAVSSHQMFLP